MKRLSLLAASAASLACMAASTDAGGGSAATGADPVKKADPAPQPQTADPAAPAEPAADPAPQAEGNAPDADPNAPTNKAEAEKGPSTAKKTYVVWVQPGHETLCIGQLFSTSADEAETLRGAGRARYAADAEIKAAKAALTKGAAIDHLDGV